MPTVKQLYREITRDQVAHQKTIAAHLARQSKARRRVVALYAEGLSDRAVARKVRRSHGAVRCMLVSTMRTIWKAINHIPRYYRSGRARRHKPPAQARQQHGLTAAQLENIQAPATIVTARQALRELEQRERAAARDTQAMATKPKPENTGTIRHRSGTGKFKAAPSGKPKPKPKPKK